MVLTLTDDGELGIPVAYFFQVVKKSNTEYLIFGRV